MKFQKYLPIGTVVLLKDAKKRIMITGFCSISDNDKTKVYDYSGCLYPEGIISTNSTLLFDHSQIEQVYYFGFVDEEEKLFKEKLNSINKDIN
ncbi:MAG: DUF4176 domain-containing protein [Firmicutes bacterium]|nr:DUF4176 domain-containing protein [Bacillota bacterium]